MTKQTKLIKFMLIILILIPLVLFSIAIVQTFVLKDANNKLLNAKESLELAESNLKLEKDKHDYIFDEDKNGNLILSDEYKEENYKHNQDENYGNDGDINIELK